MKEIFYELIKEASSGKVIIDNDEWEIAFNTSIPSKNKSYYNEQNLSELVIKDENKFFDLLEEYIELELKSNRKMPNFLEKEKSPIKWIMAYLFVNATTEDFLDPENFIKRRISFLKDETFSYLEEGTEIELGESLKTSKLKIKKSSSPITMETPNKIELSLTDTIDNEQVSFNLPDIYYGISNNTCYIYSVKMPSSKKEPSEKEEKFIKKINRQLYKLNAKVPAKEKPLTEEENITDVTPSFILALSIFMTLLKRENISEIKVVPYLPVRYLSRQLAAKDKEELQKRNDDIQKNITDKLIRTFRRLAYHDKDIQIETFPYEIDEYLTIKLLSTKEKIDNQILNDTVTPIMEGGSQK